MRWLIVYAFVAGSLVFVTGLPVWAEALVFLGSAALAVSLIREGARQPLRP